MKIHELREKRAAAVTEMRSIADKADAETRDLSSAEDTRFGELKTEIAGLDKKIERAETLATAERAAPAILVNGRGDGTFETRARDFSVTRAIRAALGDHTVDAGFEREMSGEVARRTGRAFQGIAVPEQIFLAERPEQRTLLAGSTASDLIPNVHRADLFIDRLRSSLVTERLGATVLNDLIGTVDIPRQTGSSTAQWVAEDGSITETDAAFDDVTLAPKTVGAMTSYSRRTLLSASPAIEGIVRNDLSRIIANAIDHQAMVGTGASNTPKGITHADNGAATVDLSAGATWAKILEFIANIDAADAATGSMGWTLNAWAVKKLRETEKQTDNGFIMEAPNMLAGYAAAVTSALAGNPTDSPSVPATLIFGAWNNLLVGYWSGIDILLNPFETTAYAKGRVLVRALRDVDVQVRHGAAFAYADDLPVE